MTEVLYPNGYSSTGGPGIPRAMSSIELRVDVKALEPEFWRRIKALMIHSGGTIGVGGGARSTEAQRLLFLSRYHIDDVNGTVRYNGHLWAKNPGVASAAPPGSSYHEDGTTPNGALAVDMVGDLTVLRTDGYKFGLIEFADVNNEPWHAQPLELPHARREFDLPTMYPLHAWQFPLTPAPPPEGEHMELAVLTLNNTQPKTTFLGYVNLKPTPGGGVNPQFWDVLWIDGADPAAVKMLEDQINFGGAKTYEFGEHVAKSLWLLNEDLPTSLLSDGRPWSVSDWGRVGSKAA